ncbi:MAG: hypothetical protein K2W95_32490 [Candidatus Obscuribacterales bacterium]|nr:hypothetical protein [Candidatus Obscuribacterales bacterium]
MPPNALTIENHQRFITALGDRVRSHSDIGHKPLDIDCLPPLPTKMRAYIYKTTSPSGGAHPTGGRPVGEHKIQIIVPGHNRGEKGNFDHSDGRIVFLVGLVQEMDVFVLWDATKYVDFGWSRNVQVKAETVHQAYFGQISTQLRELRGVSVCTETVICAGSRLLPEAIVQRFNMTSAELFNPAPAEMKQCPQCKVEAVGASNIEAVFGFRNMAGEGTYDVIRPQSYCRNCRSTVREGASG